MLRPPSSRAAIASVLLALLCVVAAPALPALAADTVPDCTVTHVDYPYEYDVWVCKPNVASY